MRASSRISGAIAAGFVSATVDSPAILVPGPTRCVSRLRAVHATNHERDENTRRNARNARLWCGYAQTRSNIPRASAGESVGKLLRRHAFRSARSRPASRWLRAKHAANAGNAPALTQRRSSGLRTPSPPRFSTC